MSMPDVLYEEVIEVDERVVLKQDGCQLSSKEPKRTVTGMMSVLSWFWLENIYTSAQPIYWLANFSQYPV